MEEPASRATTWVARIAGVSPLNERAEVQASLLLAHLHRKGSHGVYSGLYFRWIPEIGYLVPVLFPCLHQWNDWRGSAPGHVKWNLTLLLASFWTLTPNLILSQGSKQLSPTGFAMETSLCQHRPGAPSLPEHQTPHLTAVPATTQVSELVCLPYVIFWSPSSFYGEPESGFECFGKQWLFNQSL